MHASCRAQQASAPRVVNTQQTVFWSTTRHTPPLTWSAGALARLVAPRRHHLHPLLPVRGSQHAQRAPPPVLPGIAASRLLLLPRFPQGVGRVPHRGRALASRGGAGVKTVARGTTAGRGGRGGRRHLRGGLGRKGDGVRTRRGARAGVGGRRARTRAQVELRGHPRRGGRGGKARRQNLRPAMRRSCTSFPLARRQVGGVGGSVRQGLGPGSKTRRWRGDSGRHGNTEFRKVSEINKTCGQNLQNDKVESALNDMGRHLTRLGRDPCITSRTSFTSLKKNHPLQPYSRAKRVHITKSFAVFNAGDTIRTKTIF